MLPVSKAADDYTDGHGWAKLDQTACHELASVIASLGPREFEKHCRIVLVLYKLIGSSGTIGKGVGYRTIASAAGVTEKAARHMVMRLENDGILVRTKGGRAFWWHEESALQGADPSAPQGADPLPLDPPEGADPSAPKPARRGTHKIVEDNQNRLSSTTIDDIAASPDGGPHITEEEMAEINAKYERYMARARELGYGDAG